MSVASDTLQERLQDMQATVRMLQEELERTNHEVLLLTLELEQRVEERTEQLSRSNRELLREIEERTRADAEIKKLNEDLAQRAELLEAANEELEMFSASVSHDLRNPVARVLGYAELLEEGAGPGLSSAHQEYIQKICGASRQMAALIEELLRFSRAAHAELACGTVDLNLLVEQSIQELEQETHGREVVWKRQPLPAAFGDGSLLKQVLLNLIANALKYSRPRSPAEIEIGVLEADDEGHTFFVRDNGVGFDPQSTPKLFGAFQRLHDNPEFEGTGIGLANVRRIILRHGGRVWAEGESGKGATFYFTLPARDGLSVRQGYSSGGGTEKSERSTFP